MSRILFVDDDENLLKINRTYFEQRGYAVSTAKDGTSAQRLVSETDFDCIVLDIILPQGEDGYSICKALKARSGAPILFLTSLTEQEFLYRGFACGGDDYLTKPYDLKELMLRVEARVGQHRGRRSCARRLVFQPLTIDLTARRVTLSGNTVALTGNEFDILVLLANAPSQVFSTEEIYQGVWKMPDLDATHTVQVHVARMRRKLEEASPTHKFIQTVWGRGYLFVPVDTEK